jgi:3-oxoacyl-[acyl-carrier-protein] synthase II
LRKPDYDRRVVITGLGVVSPVGIGKEAAWDNLTNGRSGIGEITRFDISRYDHKAGGEVKDFQPLDWLDAKTARRSGRDVHMGIAAAASSS